MKITKVKWRNHPILGNLALDFTHPITHQPFETIVFAGENGTGKTSILQSISTFLNMGTFAHFEFIEYQVAGQLYRAVQPEHDSLPSFFDIIAPDGSRRQILSDKNNNRITIDTDNLDLRHYGCVFSKARADYKTKAIANITTSTVDTDKYDEDSGDDFTALKQLIVDVHNQVNSDYALLNQNNLGNPTDWAVFFPTSKMFRFKNSFNNFFTSLRYENVKDAPGNKQIIFQKNGLEIPIDALSTGEKQIVFRGIYLLKNSTKLTGAAIMIDEPELSMHPSWQTRILQYYKGLFTDATGQKVQLFVATHSEHVLKHALSDRTNHLVIVLKENGGAISAESIHAPSVLPSITSAETNYLAFNIFSNDYHIELYGWLQEKNFITSVKGCDNLIISKPQYVAAMHQHPSTHTTARGTTNYDSLPTFIRNLIHHPATGVNFTDAQLKISTELLIELCK